MTTITLERANNPSAPTGLTPAPELASGQCTSGIHLRCAAGNTLGPAQSRFDAQSSPERGQDLVPGSGSPVSGGYEWAGLLFHAEFLDDMERMRIATENRARALTQAGFDGSVYDEQAKSLAKLEHEAVLHLQRAMRRHPLGPWVKRTVGVGEKQGARLIAAIGDPYWNTLDDRPRRGPAELWAFCGFAPGQKRQRGVQSNWNPDAKKRAYLIAESCIKQMHSPYRPVYDAARASWADRDTTDLHKHNHALRLVAKELLKDLWREGRRLHLEGAA